MGKDIDIDTWNKCKEKVKGHWSELSDGDIDSINGSREKFIEIIQKVYLITEEEAEKQYEDFKVECEIQEN